MNNQSEQELEKIITRWLSKINVPGAIVSTNDLAKLITQHTEQKVLEAKKNGFYMACGLCGVSVERVEELWVQCVAEPNKLKETSNE